MEPYDFDKILKSKIAEPGDLHEKEMDTAKPFIWSAVQKEIKESRSLRWYHLAAAILLLLISFSIVLNSVQNSHQKQLMMLSGKIDLLEKNHQKQMEHLKEQNTELSMMIANQDRTREEQSEKSPLIVEKVIYQTDTVFIKQVEYIQVDAQPKHADNPTEKPEHKVVMANNRDTQKNEYDEIIYPVGSNQSSNKNSEQVKLKISAFTARRN